jgi:zinc protease
VPAIDAGPPLATVPLGGLLDGPREAVRFAEVGLARVVLGYPGVGLRDPDRLALDVLAEVLTGAGQRLANLLRARRGSLDDLVARSRVGVEPGAFSLHATARPELVEPAVAALRSELGRLVAAGVTPEEVAAARRSLIGKRALALERRATVASALAFGAALGDPARSLRRDSEDLARVGVEDVARVARRILDPKREVLAVIRPRATARPATSRSDDRGSGLVRITASNPGARPAAPTASGSAALLDGPRRFPAR